ncbi:Origin recognition complex subunit Orc5 [Pyrenophora tritici-repentis]|nr:Origin recognition complex subunit Orc5 [Pyrenophora tritici-repentis]KAI0615637.1 Origin recognition complex subunit Orc5 [Pyrenophora tritici-repentis]KAI0619873.1 Origin recognition complex subunit Orc5 [Pyrenophora tritici-repentis]
MLPEEIIAQLNAEFQCREQLIQHLAALYSAHLPSTSFLNIHGLTATGKSSILRSYFHLSQIPHAIINVRECITARHLLERMVAASLDALDEFNDETIDRRPYARTENLSALCVNMSRLLEGRAKFVLILDGMDKLREGGGTLISALARLGEMIPNLSLILTTTLALTPSILHSSSASFLHFPSYTRNELLAILGSSPPKIFLQAPSLEQFPDYTPDLAAEDDAWLWGRFLQAVYDSLSKHTGRDLISFKSCAMRLWRPFVEPVVSGQFGTRDFSRLMVNRRHLFQLEDSVLDRIISTTSTEPTINDPTSIPTTPSKKKPANVTAHTLPYFTTHILIAAYLASYNPSRTDVTYFMKHTDKRKNKRRAPSAASFSVTGKRSGTKHRKISRHLLTPSPFTLDRLLAIFRALLEGTVPQVADLYTQIATLTSMRLLVRAGGAGSNDALEGGGRWRVNFGWEYARALGRNVGVEVGEYLVGGVD